MAETTPQGHALGLVFAPPDPRNYAFPFTPEALPSPPPDIDLRPLMQPVGNQGQIGSCTGWAGTASVESRKRDGQRSPLYLYYWDRQLDGTAPTEDAGATMLALCKALQQYGVPPEELWPYNTARMAQAPTGEADTMASQCRADAYYQIKATGLTLLQGVWQALAQQQTVLLAIQVYQSFEDTGRDGKVRMPTSGERVLGGHAICACGWFNDQSAPGGYGWVMIQNSWGAEFADGGYMYLPAAYFTSGIVVEAWVVQYAAAPDPPPPPPPDPEDELNPDAISLIRNRLQAIRESVAYVQSLRPRERQTKAAILSAVAHVWDHEIGPFDDLAREAEELLGKADPPGPDPEPPAVEEDWSVLLSGAPGLVGRSKWLAGSTGCDIFVHRGTVVRAPHDGTFRFQMLPVPGVGAIGEWLLEYPDGRAVRGRHCSQPLVKSGASVSKGDPLCTVFDQTMDQLHWPRGYPTPPDGYQHLDVSLASSVGRLNPTGGAGGDVDADAHIWSQGGIPNITVVDRTPGPIEGSVGQARALWAAWTGQEIPA